jgi:hypothetical protein
VDKWLGSCLSSGRFATELLCLMVGICTREMIE